VSKTNTLAFRVTRLLVFFWAMTGYLLQAQSSDEKKTGTVDSVMAFSPFYMPVSYAFIQPCYFEPLSFVQVDTSMSGTAHYHEWLKMDKLYQNLGIYGQAHQSMGFIFYQNPGFQYLTLPFPLTFTRQQDVPFYDLQTYYTRVAYTFGISTGNQAENHFDATHAQKVKGITIGVNLHAYLNQGDFVNQKSGRFSGDAMLHYELPSKIYGLKISYIYNRLTFQENGGLADYKNDTLTPAGVYDYHAFLKNVSPQMQGYAVNTPTATSKITGNDILLQQYVNLHFKDDKINLGTLTHSFQYKDFKVLYTDPSVDTVLYANYHASDSTRDSLNFYYLTNTLQWSNFSPFEKISDKKYFIRVAAGITHEYLHDNVAREPFSQRIHRLNKDSLFRFTNHTAILFARTFIRLFGCMDVRGGISYSIAGYTNANVQAEAALQWTINRQHKHFFGIEGHYYRLSPDYIYNYYQSNLFRWDTAFPTRDIMQLGAYWSIMDIKVAFNYFALHRFSRFNADLQPFVFDKTAHLLQLHFYTPFKYKSFGFNTNFYLQYSTSDQLSLPLFAGKATVYQAFHFFKRKLHLQIGVDAMYNTSYFADGYSPVLHQFYAQNTIKTGNYFYLDAHLCLRVSRLTFFFRASNLLAGLPNNNHYFTTLYYPMENRHFQIGINWRFYD
jgi:hypothetical protein